MFVRDDTIVAISTPPGQGGIGVVRLSGQAAKTIANAVLCLDRDLKPRYATLTQVRDSPGGRPIDQVVATFFPRPNSYTGEDVVELSGHGSPVLLRQIVSATIAAGARLAEPGEFTFRGYLNGQMDLVQAEAVADLVASVTPLQARAAFDQLDGTMTDAIGEIDESVFDLIVRLEASLDFPDEGYHFANQETVISNLQAIATSVKNLLDGAGHGRLIREGSQAVIVGKPNVGKSTLFNQLCGGPRAIVTDVPGTTRDLLTETIDLSGIPVTLVDTAGVRETSDRVEAEGVQRTRGAIDSATTIVLVLDGSKPLELDDRSLLVETQSDRRLIVISKRDLPSEWVPADETEIATSDDVTAVCLLDNKDVAVVREKLSFLVEGNDAKRDVPAVTNLRHIELLRRADSTLEQALKSARAGVTEELLLTELGDARRTFEEISGVRPDDAVLRRIFESFCIGK